MRSSLQGLNQRVEGKEELAQTPILHSSHYHASLTLTVPATVVLFTVPGAFTPTCSANHLPPYLEKFDEFKSKGVDAIYVLASNDVFVMSAWGRALHAGDKIGALADPTLAWLKPAGLTQDRESLSSARGRERECSGCTNS